MGVLLPARHRIAWNLGVCEVPMLELLSLGHGLAEEGPEDHPERIERRQRGADVSDDPEREEAASTVVEEGEDVVLGEPTGEWRQARQRQAAHHKAGKGD